MGYNDKKTVHTMTKKHVIRSFRPRLIRTDTLLIKANCLPFTLSSLATLWPVFRGGRVPVCASPISSSRTIARPGASIRKIRWRCLARIAAPPRSVIYFRCIQELLVRKLFPLKWTKCVSFWYFLFKRLEIIFHSRLVSIWWFKFQG